MAMPFLLEGCFELDKVDSTAHVRTFSMRCDSGYVEGGPRRNDRIHTAWSACGLRPQEIPRDPSTEQPPTSRFGAGRDGDPASGPSARRSAGTPAAEDSDCRSRTHLCRCPQRSSTTSLSVPHLRALSSRRRVDRTRASNGSNLASLLSLGQVPGLSTTSTWAPKTATIDDFTADACLSRVPETERIFYYVESLDVEINSMQTPEYDPPILEVAACREQGGLWFDGDEPGIIVGATQAGAAAIPPGFSAAGITGFVSSLGVLTTVGGAAAATGAAGSATVVVAVSAGAVAAGTGITVAVTGEEEASGPQ